MDIFLDKLWEIIAAGFVHAGDFLFALLQHVHFMGPALLIFLIGFGTVCLIKVLNRYIMTRRYIELEKEYRYWFNLRQETSRIEDPEIKNRMARNIDQAQLNKAYYDYFFEGFLLNVLRKVLPIFFVFAFLNEYYRSERLMEMFGKGYVFAISAPGGEQVLVGSVFWFFLSLILSFILYSCIAKISFKTIFRSRVTSKKQTEMTHC